MVALLWLAVACLLVGAWYLFDCFEPRDRP
jgi:hypothetical protein